MIVITIRFLLILFLFSSPSVTAGGDSGVSSTGKVHIIIIKSFKFDPPEITIKRGDTIRWENSEKRQYHSVWFEETDEEETDYFFPEESYERSFDKIGTFPYRCGPHERMKGVVHVIN